MVRACQQVSAVGGLIYLSDSGQEGQACSPAGAAGAQVDLSALLLCTDAVKPRTTCRGHRDRSAYVVVVLLQSQKVRHTESFCSQSLALGHKLRWGGSSQSYSTNYYCTKNGFALLNDESLLSAKSRGWWKVRTCMHLAEFRDDLKLRRTAGIVFPPTMPTVACCNQMLLAAISIHPIRD